MPRGRAKISIPVPRGGYRADLPMQMIPPDSLYSCSNVIFKDGTLQIRPGYTGFQSALDGRVVGLKFWYGHDNTRHLAAVTTTKVYTQNAGFSAFSDRTNSALTGAATDYARFTVFQSGGKNNLIITNNKDTPRLWDTTNSNVTNLTNMPICRDVCTAANRVVAFNVDESGTRSASRVRISDFNDHTTWPAALVVDLIDTDDVGIACKPVGRTNVALYKTESQWLATPEGGTYPFRFELIDRMPGPVSPMAVVDVDDAHYYFGQDASFYRFDGTRTEKIGQKIQRFTRTDFNWSNRDRIHGLFLSDLKGILWFYPTADTADCDEAIYLDLESGEFSWWPWSFNGVMTASCSYTAKASTAISDLTGSIASLEGSIEALGGRATLVEFIVDTSFQIHYLGAATSDNGQAISANWQTGALPWAGDGKDMEIDSLETFFKLTTAAQNVNIDILTTDTLMAAPAAEPSQQTVDISTDSQKRATYSPFKARFASLKHGLSATQAVEYRGSLLGLDWMEAG